MAFQGVLFRKQVNLFSFWFWYALFVFCEGVRLVHFSRHGIWSLLKLELYFIDGTCKHTGYCCSHMILSYEGQDIRHLTSFSLLCQKLPTLSRFVPVLFNEQSSLISYFKCSCLGENNLCLDYENRPELCKNYPFTTFLNSGYIRNGCGYLVRRKEGFPSFSHPVLCRLVEEVDQMMV